MSVYDKRDGILIVAQPVPHRKNRVDGNVSERTGIYLVDQTLKAAELILKARSERVVREGELRCERPVVIPDHQQADRDDS